MNDPLYRPNVACILRNAAGKILIAQRSGLEGAWQFPQGGIDPGESPDEALEREMIEEIGLQPEQYRVVDRKGPYRYLFTPGVRKRGFDGQEQTYFLADLLAETWVFREDCEAGEFDAVRWIRPADFRLEWVVDFKRSVYRDVFRDFFAVSLGEAA